MTTISNLVSTGCVVRVSMGVSLLMALLIFSSSGVLDALRMAIHVTGQWTTAQ